MGVKIEAFRRDINLARQAAADPQAFRTRHAQIAKDELARVQGQQGDFPYDQVVDGQKGASLSSVQPFGVIEFHFHLLNVIVDDIYRELIALSPVGPPEGGHYADDHWLYVDGTRVAVSEGEHAFDVPPKSVVTIVNRRPYARKIETGLSVQAPNGVYEITARAMRQKYRQVATIQFSYTELGGLTRSETHGMSWRSRAKNRFPCITVSSGT